jgi:hypothetical protein
MFMTPTSPHFSFLFRGLLCGLLLASGVGQAQWLPDRLTDRGDGMLDLSEYLLEHRGILPVPIVITEPAVGYGGGLIGIFFDQPLGDALKTSLGENGKPIPPNMTAVGGFMTENGTRGGLLAHRHTWDGDRYRYLGGIGKVDARLDYYGLLGKPRGYQLDGVGLMQQFQVRAGDTDWFFGPRYAWVKVNPFFGDGWPADLGGKPLREVRIGRLSLTAAHDTRDNIFTPTSGQLVEGELVAASPELGGTTSYKQFNIRGYNWTPVGKPFILGLRGDLQTSRGDIPFFAKPFVSLRGIPALRYQDNNTAVAEVELWWQATARWSLLGFTGAGRAWGKRDDFSQAETVTTVGGGFRYLIAKRLGLHAGIDIGRGPEGTAFYIQVGSPWR